MVRYSSETFPKDEKNQTITKQKCYGEDQCSTFCEMKLEKCGPSLHGLGIFKYLEVSASIEQEDILLYYRIKLGAPWQCHTMLWPEPLGIGREYLVDYRLGRRYQRIPGRTTKFAAYAPHSKAPMTLEGSVSNLFGPIRLASFEKGDGGYSIVSQEQVMAVTSDIFIRILTCSLRPSQEWKHLFNFSFSLCSSISKELRWPLSCVHLIESV